MLSVCLCIIVTMTTKVWYIWQLDVKVEKHIIV